MECDGAVPFFELREQEDNNNHDEDTVHFSLEPKLGHPSNMQTQLGWDAVQLSEAMVLP